ncbi:hypothetical protein RRG08_016558 [Elysia crispata]|uniref:G-protein coupled receptors family 1 profile domain-containing protein n=1 Tax=Elysia crispata TaxID=231223 RepID=A0AAE1E4B8_9GAST|nr:hypothetical protein RRG08_016558 [Elysia crispata]
MGHLSGSITTPVAAVGREGGCQPAGNKSYENNGSRCAGAETEGGIPEYYKDAQITFLVFLFFFIVIGNIIVLAAISLSRERRRSRMNFFIMHLALCDLLTGPLIVLVDIVTKLTEYWYAGDALCKMLKFSQVAVAYSSTYMLVALSIDRLDAIARPLHFTGSWLRAKVLVATAWLLSAVFAVPQLILFQVVQSQSEPMCHLHLETVFHWRVYLILVALSIFFIPACIILVCYVAIIVVIFNSSDLSSGVNRGSKSKETEMLRSRGEGERTPRDSSVSCQSSRGIIPQAKIRTIKMTFIIVFVFILCWSPYFVFNLCSVFGALPNTATTQKVTVFIQSLAPLNSAANPLIYGVFSTRICRFLRRAPVIKKMSGSALKSCCLSNSTTTPSGQSTPNKCSTGDYTSMTETDDFRLTGDSVGITRIPLVKQQLTEEDKQLLSKHLKPAGMACDTNNAGICYSNCSFIQNNAGTCYSNCSLIQNNASICYSDCSLIQNNAGICWSNCSLIQCIAGICCGNCISSRTLLFLYVGQLLQNYSSVKYTVGG